MMHAPTIALAMLLAAASALHAEMGPCQPDERDGLVCGSGTAAARVIAGTISPSRQYALAWRDLTGPPTEEPDTDQLETLLVRLSDGAILAGRKSDFWDTGEVHVNRLREEAAWSRDSRLVLRVFKSRFETHHIDAHAIGTDGSLVGSLDVRKIIEPAVRARLRQRTANDYTFSLKADRSLSLQNDGRLQARVMMWVPKEGPESHFDVSMQLTRGKGPLSARVTSVRPARVDR
jgi:hypothetical protein